MSSGMLKNKVELPDSELMMLADRIVLVIGEGKAALAIRSSETIKATYLPIGR